MKSRKIKKKYLHPISEDDICQDVIMTKYELIFVWSEKTDIFKSSYIGISKYIDIDLGKSVFKIKMIVCKNRAFTIFQKLFKHEINKIVYVHITLDIRIFISVYVSSTNCCVIQE